MKHFKQIFKGSMRVLVIITGLTGCFCLIWSTVVQDASIAVIAAGVIASAIGGKYIQKRLEMPTRATITGGSDVSESS
jgi:ABC-type Fe3+-siderophore transport system permease subunit